MAHTTSLLRTKMTTEAQNNEGVQWSAVEAAVELLLGALSGTITVSSSENLAQVNGHTVTEGSGTNGNGTQRVTLATDDALNAAVGVISGAAVTTDANGTLQQYLRGIVKLWSIGTVTTPATNIITTQRPGVTQVVSTALEASHVLKASAGQLVELSVFNGKASAQFILLMNSTTVPGDGAVTLLYPPIPVAAASLIVLDLPAPLVASTGIAICNSSTGTFTKTVGSADCVFYAQVN